MPSEPASARLASCLYEGVVHHRRHLPIEHAFHYRLCQLYLDLDELDLVFRGRIAWSTRGPALAWFRRADHLGDPNRPLADCVRELVESETGRQPSGPIRLLTHPRYLGFVMNPVSFYYCFDAAGDTVEAVVAEVHNTPWNERHCYVIDRPVRSPGEPAPEFAKSFHVSPFLPMEMAYRWSVGQPGRSLSIRIENHDDRGRVFDAALSLRRRPITSANLLRSLVRFPLMTAQVFAGIYWQALRLWWKGAAYHPHPASRTAPAGRASTRPSLPTAP